MRPFRRGAMAWLMAGLAGAGWAAGPSGRWNLEVTSATVAYPGWLEISGPAEKPRVRYVGRVGNVREISDFRLGENALSFARNEWFGAYEMLEHRFQFGATSVTGVFTRANGETLTVAGSPAPALQHPPPPRWSEPRALFNGRDFTGWKHTQSPVSTSNWRIDRRELVTFGGGGDLRTVEEFGDFVLHLEFHQAVNANSGVYLRGRYELQIEDDSPQAPAANQTGAIYGWLAPAVTVPREPARWHRLDITLVGRRVTVVLDGITLYADAEIPGITGGALDGREGAPGPIVLQASHSKTRGDVRFRNLTVATPLP